MRLIVHGGAGNRKPTREALNVLAQALAAGYAKMKQGGPALDAVVKAITVMENSGQFNAGIGGNLQLDGVRRLDASVMEGANLKAGAVTGVEVIRNPILAARKIMESPHVLFTNAGAPFFGKDLEPMPAVDKRSLRRLEQMKKNARFVCELYAGHFSTVGAVAIDANGNLAAGTSTGGSHAMLPGRVGDSPIIGAGTYADNKSGAVSCTGSGESILRLSLAKEICMNLKKAPPAGAVRPGLKRILQLSGQAGVIVIDSNGRFTIMHTTGYMASGFISPRVTTVLNRWRMVRLDKARMPSC